MAAVHRAVGHRHDPVWQHQPLPFDTVLALVAVVQDALIQVRLGDVLVGAVEVADAVLERRTTLATACMNGTGEAFEVARPALKRAVVTQVCKLVVDVVDALLDHLALRGGGAP